MTLDEPCINKRKGRTLSLWSPWGVQVVPTSMTPDELCINGMSFSRRQSKWANSALVVGTHPSDWQHLVTDHGVLAGVQLQRDAER